MMSDHISILKFTLSSGKVFGIDIANLRNIVKVTKLNRLPSMSDLVIGVMQDRGSSIPVIDTSRALSQGTDKNNLDGKLILISEINNAVYGFVISSADSILKVTEGMISQQFDSSSCLLTLVVNEEKGRMVSVIDTEAVIKAALGKA